MLYALANLACCLPRLTSCSVMCLLCRNLVKDMHWGSMSRLRFLGQGYYWFWRLPGDLFGKKSCFSLQDLRFKKCWLSWQRTRSLQPTLNALQALFRLWCNHVTSLSQPPCLNQWVQAQLWNRKTVHWNQPWLWKGRAVQWRIPRPAWHLCRGGIVEQRIPKQP